ncbi:MAG: efflux RND transporter periplasmic adaptor subunit [Pseudomonadota bacterium]
MTVADVQTRMMAETVPVFADVVTARDGVIASRVSGTVSEVHVLAGVSVSEGAELVTLDTELAEIELRQAEARLAEAVAGVETAAARRNRLNDALRRIERLRETAAFSQGRFEEAEGELLTSSGQFGEAEARVATAEATIAEVRYRIDRAVIRAPFSGVVLETLTNPGEFLASGASVVRLLDTRALEVEAAVPSAYIGTLVEGAVLRGQAASGQEMQLTLRAVLPIEDRATRTRAVRFVPVGEHAALLAAVGQSVTVEVPVEAPREALAVPKDALVQGQSGWTVFVASDGTAEPRPVQIGAALGEWFEVLNGLELGEQVVIRGNERLRPGQPIQPMPSQ